ncbi:hypothetical protein PR202_gn00389 [Eleusine coracana subsp. coracana]|uniref:Uncharacterized protein n=1 Tax=Eleusine coracana subsp. coracana TaxID=191504 RepID=A0AAV5FZK3_ELECO|nr:hypothetical protein PR202_gn00389 [Eleusine coracana subsp. coracana]
MASKGSRQWGHAWRVWWLWCRRAVLLANKAPPPSSLSFIPRRPPPPSSAIAVLPPPRSGEPCRQIDLRGGSGASAAVLAGGLAAPMVEVFLSRVPPSSSDSFDGGGRMTRHGGRGTADGWIDGRGQMSGQWTAHITPIHLHGYTKISTSLVPSHIQSASPHQTLSCPSTHPFFFFLHRSSTIIHGVHQRQPPVLPFPPPPPPPSTPGADQEFTSHHHNLFLPCSSSPTSLYLDSSFHGLLPHLLLRSHVVPFPIPSTSARAASAAPSPIRGPPRRPRSARGPPAGRPPPCSPLTPPTSAPWCRSSTGFPAPPFAAAPPPAVRPRLLGGPPFLMRPSPLKYPQSSMLLPPSSCTATLANTAINTAAAASNNNNNITTTSSSSLVDALALFAKSSVMQSSAGASAMPGGSGAAAAAADHHYHGIGMGGFNPFDDFENPVAAERESINGGAAHGSFFSSFAAGDKYGGRH